VWLICEHIKPLAVVPASYRDSKTRKLAPTAGSKYSQKAHGKAYLSQMSLTASASATPSLGGQKQATPDFAEKQPETTPQLYQPGYPACIADAVRQCLWDRKGAVLSVVPLDHQPFGRSPGGTIGVRSGKGC